MSVAVYPGTFDPITYGHIDVAERAAKVFSDLIILVMNNPGKSNAMFSVEERVSLIQNVFSNISNICVASYRGLLVDYARLTGHNVIIRGLRAVSDFEYEMTMAAANRRMYDSFETFFLMTDTKSSFISSSLVKEIAINGGKIDPWVPESVKQEIYKKLEK